MLRYICLAIILLISGCSKELSKQEYIDYSNNVNGSLVQRTSIKKINVDCFFRTNEFQNIVSNKDNESNKKVNSDSIAPFFHVSIYPQRGNGEDVNFLLFGAGNKRDSQLDLSYNLKKSFYLLNGKDSLNASFAHIDKSWGMSKDVLIAAKFPKISEDSLHKYELLIKDIGLNIGDIKFSLKKYRYKHLKLK